MIVDVYSGAKPGRPALLVSLCGGLLAATLALAWAQVRDSRALGPSVGIGEGVMTVRPPRGWIEDPERPGTFLAASPRGEAPARLVASRSVSFGYERLPVFRSPTSLIGSSSFVPAKIGPLDGVQARFVQRYSLGRRIYEFEVLKRIACSPRGDVVIVTYTPLTGATISDLELLDALCAEIRIAGLTTADERASLFARAGVSVAGDVGVCMPPSVEGEAGVFIQGSQGGIARWSLGVFRAFLGPGRTPQLLLTDLGLVVWELPQQAIRIEESRRADGATIATIHYADVGLGPSPLAAALLISASPDESAYVLVFCDDDQAAAAGAAARRLAESVTFDDSAAAASVAKAVEAGAALANLLSEDGGTRWWRSTPVRSYYLGQTVRGTEALVVERRRTGAVEAGYGGAARHLYPDGGGERIREALRTWTSDAVGGRYLFEYEGERGVGDRAVPASLRESRAGAGAEVKRNEQAGGVRRTVTFSPGPAFVSSPYELLAEAWVAWQDAGVWLVEMSTEFGVGSHWCRIETAPPDSAGRRRCVLVRDYWPLGERMTFDSEWELHGSEASGARFERVDRREAESQFPVLRRLPPLGG